MNRSPRPLARFALAALLAAAGCIEPDPEFPPPIEAVPLASRVKVAVTPIANETPSATVAQWSFATRRLLVELLERSRRFVVVDPALEPAERTLVLRFIDVRDEVFNETIVFGREQLTGVQRRAVVEMEWSAGSGAPERIVSDDYSPGSVPLALPTPVQLDTGSFWETPYGRATRTNLDLVVRRLSAGSPR